MQNYAISNSLTPFISMQDHHSLLYREEEREMFPTLKMFGVSAIPWSPLSRGLLARPWSATSTRGDVEWVIKRFTSAITNSGNEEIVNRVEELAKRKGITMVQVAVAWSLSGHVAAPIVGTTSLKNLEELIDAVHIELTTDDIQYLEEPYKPMPILGFS
ncbi:hypothetical protein HGRIS_000715 [Hohenbuehelia grisea]|uniref:NADP-dependent oxidoreductase domain-containing protein n=1 Tax=Hohenbuehelia grisea TaxID=104357 RepID=A0ABR3JTX5_9AGAR